LSDSKIEVIKIAPGPWSEYLGTVDVVDEDSIILLCTQRIKIHVPHHIIRRWRHLLRKGSRIAILKLDDGSLRLRRLPVGQKPLRLAKAARWEKA